VTELHCVQVVMIMMEGYGACRVLLNCPMSEGKGKSKDKGEGKDKKAKKVGGKEKVKDWDAEAQTLTYEIAETQGED